MVKKKVAIIGAGPAGLLAAHNLADYAEVRVYDQGKPANKRNCYEKKDGKCVGCSPCDKTHGAGGAGLMSDGKLLFDPLVGNNLDEVVGRERNKELIDNVERFFSDYDVTKVERKTDKVEELERKALQNEIDFVYPKQTHVGSDKLPALINKIQKDLESKGVKFFYKTEIKDLKDLEYDFVLLAPGRVGGGNGWLEGILKKNSVDYTYRPIDVGVRVEVPHQIADPVTEISWDMKFYIRTKCHDDAVRTFCTCPKGFVGREKYEEFNIVNGEASKDKKSGNTNFSILSTIPLTKPLSNSNEYARLIAQTFDRIGNSKPILQRYGDLKKGSRSKEANQERYLLQPTLNDVTLGDISMAMPGRHLDNIKEAIERFDKVLPGLKSDQTLLYAPEIKFHGLKIKTDEYLHAKNGIYVAGDGAGLSRGIVGAAVSGVLAAEGIKKQL